MWEDIFISEDINMTLNSFLNTFLRPFYGTFQRIHKMRSKKRFIGWITLPAVT
jgi:hypothetical protein